MFFPRVQGGLDGKGFRFALVCVSLGRARTTHHTIFTAIYFYIVYVVSPLLNDKLGWYLKFPHRALVGLIFQTERGSYINFPRDESTSLKVRR